MKITTSTLKIVLIAAMALMASETASSAETVKEWGERVYQEGVKRIYQQEQQKIATQKLAQEWANYIHEEANRIVNGTGAGWGQQGGSSQEQGNTTQYQTNNTQSQNQANYIQAEKEKREKQFKKYIIATSNTIDDKIENYKKLKIVPPQLVVNPFTNSQDDRNCYSCLAINQTNACNQARSCVQSEAKREANDNDNQAFGSSIVRQCLAKAFAEFKDKCIVPCRSTNIKPSFHSAPNCGDLT